MESQRGGALDRPVRGYEREPASAAAPPDATHSAGPAIPDVHLNLNVRGMGRSATLAVNERSADLKRAGRKVFRLGLGQSPFPVPEEVVDALRANAHQKDYLPVQGLPELRSAVAGYFSRRQGLEALAGDVLVGPGSKELMFILQLVYYGDLMIPTPSWVSYAPQARIIGRNVHWLPTTAEGGWPLLPAELDAACRDDPGRPRIVVLNYPSNPTGQTYEPEALADLAEVARRYRVILLSDEIYGELHFTGDHLSIARYYPEGTIISSGLSKWCGAGGWRLGTFLFPPTLAWLREAMTVVASETYTSTSAPIQYAGVTAFNGSPGIERYLRSSRRILAALGASAHRRLTEAGLSVAPPRGAFYLFPDFSPLAGRLRERGITSSAELCRRLLEEAGVAMLPGTDFGRPAAELTARIALVDFDGAAALRALDDLGQEEPSKLFLATHCGGVIEAIEAICRWLD